MLETKDLEAIRQIMREEIGKSENLVLKELDRVQEGLNTKVEQIQKNLDELKQYYRINRLENDNTALLLQMIQELTKRVSELEKKTA